MAGCVVGAPPGFSSGDKWTFPLVAPLENGQLLVPVKINDTGPYLFMVDPDSEVSSIDSGISADLKPYTTFGPEKRDERDKFVPVALAEIQKISVGDLSVRNRTVRVHKMGTYWVGGRRVRGILGRDVIADSLIVSFDRDRGVATIATQGNLDAPVGATAIKYRHEIGGADHKPVSRKVAKGMINNSLEVQMHLDLGAQTSALFAERIRDAKLPTINVSATLVDELGSSFDVSKGAIAAMVSIGGVQANGIMFLPYGDQRFRPVDLDGLIGQNFLSNYNVTVNWHKKTFYLAERTADVNEHTAERLARWGNAFESCTNPACVGVTLTGGAPELKVQPAPEPQPAPAPAPAGPATGDDPGTDPAGKPAAPLDPNEGAPEVPEDDPNSRPAPMPEDEPEPMPIRPPDPDPVPQPPAAPTLEVTREANAPAQSYEVLLEAVNADGAPIGLPRIVVTINTGVQAVFDDLDPSYAAASDFRVLDVSPFPRECNADAGGKQICMWQLSDSR